MCLIKHNSYTNLAIPSFKPWHPHLQQGKQVSPPMKYQMLLMSGLGKFIYLDMQRHVFKDKCKDRTDALLFIKCGHHLSFISSSPVGLSHGWGVVST